MEAGLEDVDKFFKCTIEELENEDKKDKKENNNKFIIPYIHKKCKADNKQAQKNLYTEILLMAKNIHKSFPCISYTFCYMLYRHMCVR